MKELKKFHVGKRIIDKKDINWCPVVKITDNYMGISDDGEWVVEVSEGIHVLSEIKLFVFVLPLLERSLSSINLTIIDFLSSLSVELDPKEIFPYLKIIQAGLEKESDYWAGLALMWYKELSIDEKNTLKQSLSLIVKAKWASQKNRQIAQRELRRLSI
ncbi:hypothetical protein [Hahella ganghwensis]|uniref:hypothetical protein n=1 Tax=Hahella ganghwensis TaxID=286420 RepID=UPI0012FC80CB|nr:hypothetical protein [Hahella ganghwensis]